VKIRALDVAAGHFATRDGASVIPECRWYQAAILSIRKLSGTIGMKPDGARHGHSRAWEALDETGRVADIATARTAFQSPA
jgi:hypothetical protein